MSTTTKTTGLQALREKFLPKGYASATDCYVEKAVGALIFDVEGREFIDFGGGIAVMNVGHSHPKVVAAIKDQAEKFTHTCFMAAPYAAALELAQKLADKAPVKPEAAVMFVNSGAEAVENAVKIVRYATKKQAVISFLNAFHGRTLLTMTLTSKVMPYTLGFGPFAPEIYQMPYAYCYRCSYGLSYPDCGVCCADYLSEMFIAQIAPEATAAVIAEPVQGEGGFIVPPKEFFSKLMPFVISDEQLEKGLGILEEAIATLRS